MSTAEIQLEAERSESRELLEELNAVDVGQPETGQNDVGTPVPEEFFPALAAKRSTNVVAFRFENLAKPVSGGWFLVDYEYAPAALAVQRHRFFSSGTRRVGYHTVCNSYTQPFA